MGLATPEVGKEEPLLRLHPMLVAEAVQVRLVLASPRKLVVVTKVPTSSVEVVSHVEVRSQRPSCKVVPAINPVVAWRAWRPSLEAEKEVVLRSHTLQEVEAHIHDPM